MKTEINGGEIVLVLTMAPKEAMALKAVCGTVSGDPNGPSSAARAIYEALEDHGIADDYTSHKMGSIAMPSGWEVK